MSCLSVGCYWHMLPWASYQIRKLRVAHARGMPGTFSPPLCVRHRDMHKGTCVTHMPWCMPGSLTSGFLQIRWRRKRSRYSRCMRNPQFCLSGKRPVYFDTNYSVSRQMRRHLILVKLWSIQKCGGFRDCGSLKSLWKSRNANTCFAVLNGV